jgi:hypothetical protein
LFFEILKQYLEIEPHSKINFCVTLRATNVDVKNKNGLCRWISTGKIKIESTLSATISVDVKNKNGLGIEVK